MSFRYPVVAVLAIVVGLLLLAWTWYRPGRRTVLPADQVSRSRGLGWLIPVNLAESLPAFLATLVILLLAGPQKLGEPENKRELTNIEICLDVSGSMTAPFGEGSRYDGAMKSLNEFLSFRKGDAFGLTFFGSNTINWCPLTTDVSAIKCSPPFMRPEMAPPWMGGTEIAKALRYCRKVLNERTEGDRMVVLISDGDSFDLYGVADELAKDLTKDRISVFAILIGVGAIQEEITEITQKTGGEAFIAGDPEALKSIFKKIDQLKQAKMAKKIAEAKDDFRPYCVAGMVLLGLQLCMGLGLRYTPW